MIEYYTITEQNIKLIRELNIDRHDLCIDQKRPFGNKAVAEDIAAILDWEWPDEDEMGPEEYDEKSDAMRECAMVVYRRTGTALEIVTSRAGLDTPPGHYKRVLGHRRGDLLWTLESAVPKPRQDLYDTLTAEEIEKLFP